MIIDTKDLTKKLPELGAGWICILCILVLLGNMVVLTGPTYVFAFIYALFLVLLALGAIVSFAHWMTYS